MLPLIRLIVLKSESFAENLINLPSLNKEVTINNTIYRNNNSNEGVVFANPYQYGWTILEKTFCTVLYPNLTVIIVIHSAADHFKQRILLRQMYGQRFYKQVRYSIYYF
ncbi:unnamed protein product [Brugia pahangi]|uniref:Uncharacterized protein n=1 Tax=Brugia pahangi TaxID=6280 RepID=A0A0N4TK46_BRUPA|nr:unnamed protein product [Brugia pahangi]